MPESELPLTEGGTGPPAYSDCLRISWIVKMKARVDPSHKKILLQKIVQMAKIHYARPICLHGSAPGKGVLQPCVKVNDAGHTGLQSKHQNQFLELFPEIAIRSIKLIGNQLDLLVVYKASCSPSGITINLPSNNNTAECSP